MKPDTLSRLNELGAVDWFRAVGQPDTTEAIVLRDWPEALARLESEEWTFVLTDEVGRYHQRLRLAAPARAQQWNEMLDALRPDLMALVERQLERAPAKLNAARAFGQVVNYDIMMYAVELEHADVCPPGFYTEQARWYARGHVPCGRESYIRPGRTIVY